MTAATRDLAGRARAIMQASDGLVKDAARCAYVALGCSPSVDVARAAIGEIGPADIRRAALRLLDELAADAAATMEGGK